MSADEMGAALLRAADTVAWQAGEETEGFVRWLTAEGGMAKMALRFFGPSDADIGRGVGGLKPSSGFCPGASCATWKHDCAPRGLQRGRSS